MIWIYTGIMVFMAVITAIFAAIILHKVHKIRKDQLRIHKYTVMYWQSNFKALNPKAPKFSSAGPKWIDKPKKKGHGWTPSKDEFHKMKHGENDFFD